MAAPFDELAHTVDVRRVGSPPLPRTLQPPQRRPLCLAAQGLFCYRDAGSRPGRHRQPLLHLQRAGQRHPAVQPTRCRRRTQRQIARETNLPIPIERRTLEEHRDELYGAGRSLYIRMEDSQKLVLPEKIVPADLGDWSHTPPRGQVAVDPERGRIAFNPRQAPSGRRPRLLPLRLLRRCRRGRVPPARPVARRTAANRRGRPEESRRPHLRAQQRQ